VIEKVEKEEKKEFSQLSPFFYFERWFSLFDALIFVFARR